MNSGSFPVNIHTIPRSQWIASKADASAGALSKKK
jgi:hypothetical protein